MHVVQGKQTVSETAEQLCEMYEPLGQLEHGEHVTSVVAVPFTEMYEVDGQVLNALPYPAGGVLPSLSCTPWC